MPYPSKMKRLEKQYGKPMRQLLPEMANELGSMQEVAKRWHVNPATLVKWKNELGVDKCWVEGECDVAARKRRPEQR